MGLQSLYSDCLSNRINMAFYGKTFKKTRLENVEEFMEALKVPEKTRLLIKNMDTTSTFKKNDDGSIQYIVSKGDAEVFSQKLTPGVESDFITPDGQQTKVHFTINGDVLESILTFPDGGKLNMHRVFEGNTMKHIVWKDGLDMKSITHYEVA